MPTQKNKPLRKCKFCGVESNDIDSLELFSPDKRMKYGKQNVCKKCDCKTYHHDKKEDSLYLKRKRDGYFKSKYGMTQAQRNVYVESKGFCEICGDVVIPETAQMDHSHNPKKGHVRGVLCITCNTGLGKFGDSVDLLNKAMKYLIRTEYKLDPENYGLESILDSQYHKLNMRGEIKLQFPKEE